MLNDQENIFDVPHSLPSSAHSIALSTRTPTELNKVQATKYMPDYGGTLEIPGIRSKNCGLKKGLPFHPKPYYVRVICNKETELRQKFGTPDNLVVASYLDQDDDSDSIKYFSAIRALGSTLYFNAIQCFSDDPPEVQESSTYAHVPYSYSITGLKYYDTLKKYLIVKFDRGVKLIYLNKSYKIPAQISLDDSDDEDTTCDTIATADQSAINFVGSFAARSGSQVGDACLSTNQNVLAMASSNKENITVNLYDLARSKKCYKTIIKARDDNAQIATEMAQSRTSGRRKSPRTFVPLGSPRSEELRQIESDPSHIIHMLLTTSNRVALIDLRADTVQHDYVDRFKLLSTTPTELFQKVVFSRKTEQQFYLMSNSTVRVFDRRFLSKPLNSIEHQLDTTYNEMMNMKLISNESDDLETLCISSLGRLCFMTFDHGYKSQSLVGKSGEIINPVSLHQPLHEPSPASITGKQCDELYGLDVASNNIFNGDEIVFSVFQLSQQGDVCVRGYETSSEDDERPVEIDSQARIVINQHKSHKFQSNDLRANPDLSDNDLHRSSVISDSDDDYFNVLDSNYVTVAEERLTSKRASKKYDWMKTKLCKR